MFLMREGFSHETVKRFFTLLLASVTVATTPTRNFNPNPNPNQRHSWLVCQLVVVLGKAPFAARAHVRKEVRLNGQIYATWADLRDIYAMGYLYCR